MKKLKMTKPKMLKKVRDQEPLMPTVKLTVMKMTGLLMSVKKMFLAK